MSNRGTWQRVDDRAPLCNSVTYRPLEPAGSSTPERVVNLVDNVRSADDASVEATAVEALKSLLAAGHGVELDKNFALTVSVDSNMNDLAVLLITLRLDFNFKVFNPVITPVALLPIVVLATSAMRQGRTYSSGSKAFSILMHLDAMGLSTAGTRGLLTTG